MRAVLALIAAATLRDATAAAVMHCELPKLRGCRPLGLVLPTSMPSGHALHAWDSRLLGPLAIISPRGTHSWRTLVFAQKPFFSSAMAPDEVSDSASTALSLVCRKELTCPTLRRRMCVAQELVKKVLEAKIRDAIPLAGTVNAGQATQTYTDFDLFQANLEHHLPALSVFLCGKVKVQAGPIPLGKTYLGGKGELHNLVKRLYKKACFDVIGEFGMVVQGSPSSGFTMGFGENKTGPFWEAHVKADWEREQAARAADSSLPATVLSKDKFQKLACVRGYQVGRAVRPQPCLEWHTRFSHTPCTHAYIPSLPSHSRVHALPGQADGAHLPDRRCGVARLRDQPAHPLRPRQGSRVRLARRRHVDCHGGPQPHRGRQGEGTAAAGRACRTAGASATAATVRCLALLGVWRCFAPALAAMLL